MVTIEEAKQQIADRERQIETAEGTLNRSQQVLQSPATVLKMSGIEGLRQRQFAGKKIGSARQQIEAARAEIAPVKQQIQEYEDEFERQRLEVESVQADYNKAKKVSESQDPRAIFSLQNERQRQFYRDIMEGRETAIQLTIADAETQLGALDAETKNKMADALRDRFNNKISQKSAELKINNILNEPQVLKVEVPEFEPPTFLQPQSLQSLQPVQTKKSFLSGFVNEGLKKPAVISDESYVGGIGFVSASPTGPESTAYIRPPTPAEKIKIDAYQNIGFKETVGLVADIPNKVGTVVENKLNSWGYRGIKTDSYAEITTKGTMPYDPYKNEFVSKTRISNEPIRVLTPSNIGTTVEFGAYTIPYAGGAFMVAGGIRGGISAKEDYQLSKQQSSVPLWQRKKILLGTANVALAASPFLPKVFSKRYSLIENQIGKNQVLSQETTILSKGPTTITKFGESIKETYPFVITKTEQVAGVQRVLVEEGNLFKRMFFSPRELSYKEAKEVLKANDFKPTQIKNMLRTTAARDITSKGFGEVNVLYGGNLKEPVLFSTSQQLNTILRTAPKNINKIKADVTKLSKTTGNIVKQPGKFVAETKSGIEIYEIYPQVTKFELGKSKASFRQNDYPKGAYNRLTQKGKTTETFREVSGVKPVKEGSWFDAKTGKEYPATYFKTESIGQRTIPKSRKLEKSRGEMIVIDTGVQPTIVSIEPPIKVTKLPDVSKPQSSGTWKSIKDIYGPSVAQKVEQAKLAAVLKLIPVKTPKVSPLKISPETKMESQFYGLGLYERTAGGTLPAQVDILTVKPTTFTEVKQPAMELNNENQFPILNNKLDTKLNNENRFGLNIKQPTIELNKDLPGLREVPKLSTKLRTKLETNLKFKMATITKQRERTSTKNPPRTPRVPKIPKLKGSYKGKITLPTSLARKAYNVIVGMGSKQKIIGKMLPIGKATKLGVEKNLGDLSASFKLEEAGLTTMEDINFKAPSNIFRPSKREAGRLVQKSKFRLSARSEVGEIQRARRNKKLKLL